MDSWRTPTFSSLAEEARKVVRSVQSRRFVRDTSHRIGAPVRRRLGHPLLQEITTQSEARTFTDPELCLNQFFGIPPTFVAESAREFVALREELERRVADAGPLPYPSYFAADNSTTSVLYTLTRYRKPQHIVETGVANGFTSYFLLAALRNNGLGVLHSIDIGDDVGAVVSSEEREGWDLHVAHPRRVDDKLRALCASVAEIDLFFHDSDHRYGWQLFEFREALAHLAPGGILGSDDVDSSFAFIDFCREQPMRRALLIDATKVSGYLVS
jgi:predicted O-methyltransferase YrrM